jgi:acyl carrier protein
MEQKLLEIINTVLSNRGKEQLKSLNTNIQLRNDIGFDSLDLAELTVRIEAEFGVDIFEDGIVSTIGDIISKITVA